MIQAGTRFILNDVSELFIIEEMVREIKQKSFSAMATWNGKTVWVRGNRSKRKALKEQRGMLWLRECGILTPEYFGLFQSNPWSFNVYEYCEQAKTLRDALNLSQDVHSSENIELLKSLMIEFATHHVFGVLQRIPYPNDFLRVGEKWMLTHGNNIVRKNAVLPKSFSFNQLARFFSIMGFRKLEEFRELLHAYAAARGWQITEKECQWVARRVWMWNLVRSVLGKKPYSSVEIK